jgi:hypothetical protein
MISSTIEDERYLTNYIGAFNSVFRAAPAPISKHVGGPSGLLLMVETADLSPGKVKKAAAWGADTLGGI